MAFKPNQVASIPAHAHTPAGLRGPTDMMSENIEFLTNANKKEGASGGLGCFRTSGPLQFGTSTFQALFVTLFAYLSRTAERGVVYHRPGRDEAPQVVSCNRPPNPPSAIFLNVPIAISFRVEHHAIKNGNVEAKL